jgi:hypothetical protein
MVRGIIIKGNHSPKNEAAAKRYMVKREEAKTIFGKMEASGLATLPNKRSPAQISYMESRRFEVQKIAAEHGCTIFVCTPPPKPPKGKVRHYS